MILERILEMILERILEMILSSNNEKIFNLFWKPEPRLIVDPIGPQVF